MIDRRRTLPRFFAALTAAGVILAACGGGGGGAVSPGVTVTATPRSTPTVAPTATPSGMIVSPNAATAYNCPTSDSATSVAQTSGSVGTDAVRRMNGLGQTRLPQSIAGRLTVTYSTAAASGAMANAITAREQAAGATLVQSFTFANIGKVVHVLSVPPAQTTAIAAVLRSQAGVENVAASGGRRYPTSVTTPYFPNDPYFQGFTAAQNALVGSTAAATFEVGPYEEGTGVPGQWDMHAIGLEHAFGYSQTNNGSGIVNSNALGSSAIKIAIIDTGEDSTQPELASKIVYQHCYITNTKNVPSSTAFETDPLGHGTDVTGIAAASIGNGFGFAGAGGNVQIYAYRVFPTPDDNCTNEMTTDPQCGSDTNDVASAINDAVAHHVNIISMSLGGDVCGSGSGFASNGDPDITEGTAVANAIAANIVVVAASGNGAPKTVGVSSPACDAGVIAVGATALADGTTNASGVAGGTETAPIEYVTSYSQSGTTNTYQSASSWGIVAPGGDPANDMDLDDLHWIENTWTSTPYEASPTDTSFQGECTDDYPNSTGKASPVDCRALIAGTSMATPHVAGAAALIIAVNPSYQSPTLMKQLLCSTADNVGGNQGCGRLNVYRAMATALNDPVLP